MLRLKSYLTSHSTVNKSYKQKAKSMYIYAYKIFWKCFYQINYQNYSSFILKPLYKKPWNTKALRHLTIVWWNCMAKLKMPQTKIGLKTIYLALN